MFVKEIFVERLNTLITQNKVTQKEISEQLGISRPAVSQFTTGASLPSIDKLTALADFFSVSLDYLVGRNNEKAIELFLKPDGELYYYFSIHKDNKNNAPIHGSLKYTFGVYPHSKELTFFLFLEERPGGTLITPNILHSASHLEFLSLVSLLNWKLQFKYNPFDRKNMDIIIPLESSDGCKYQGVKIEEIRPAHLYSLDYCDYIEQYLKKDTLEKIHFLADYLEKFNEQE